MYLNCHSYYSFRYGTLSEEYLLQLAQFHQIPSIALTDINNTSACLNFIRLSAKYNIKPIIGIDFRHGVESLYVGLARNNQGFFQLNAFLSAHKHHSTHFPASPPSLPDVAIIYPFEQIEKLNKEHFKENEYIGLSVKTLNRFRFSKWKTFSSKCIILQTVSFIRKKDFNTHRLLRAIDKNTLLSKLPKEEQADFHDYFIPPGKLKEYFRDIPSIVKNTEALMEECHIHFDFAPHNSSQNIACYTSHVDHDRSLLKRLCHRGLLYRYHRITPDIQQRLEKELKLIDQMNFNSFFLTNWDIIRYAKHKGYYHVGRGSGANSIVAYLLGITDVDPIELDLYFERFINLYRSSPPDFDIDFSSRDRPDITRYIFNRFKRNNQVALLGAYNTFQQNATRRELGKVFGLPAYEIEKLTKYNTPHPPSDELHRLVLRYSDYIQGMPNHLTVHAAGILISERPIHYFSATDLPPKGFQTVHFDMQTAEDVGLYKYDILGQRGLGKIKEALEIIRYNQPEAPKIDIHNARPFMLDKKVNELVRKAECMGCFYVESPAMRMLLKKLEVDNYLGLVAASSIIRPGVAQSGMMREYILRHKIPEKRKEAHPVMARIMPETYGIMVYQEDVIKVAHYFAGLTLSEADVLRRGMSGKYRSREEFQKVKEKFISNCRKKTIPDQIIFDVWRQIESFAGYAFAKGHSASYAVESYQSLFLKTYYPLEFMVAVLNNGGGFYRTPFYIHEAQRLGAQIVAPCMNQSFWKTTIQGKRIFLGFQHINGMNKELIQKAILHRKHSGSFISLQDFMDRISISPDQLELLIRVGAFDFTGINKRELLWQMTLLGKPGTKNQSQFVLFKRKPKTFTLPDLYIHSKEHAFDQMELLGFSLTSPFTLIDPLILKNHLCVKDLPQYENQEIEILGHFVNSKKTQTVNHLAMHFGTFLDQDGQWIDTVHFPEIAKQYPFRGKGIYRIKGKVIHEFGFLSIEVREFEKIPFIEDPRYALPS